MSIDTKRLNLGKLLGSVNEVFRIPLYQRPYNWGKDQWNDLWEDLIRLDGDETHFLGSIITISQERQNGFVFFEVVDGQQRITTILILLTAIRDLAEEIDKDRASYINNYFLKSSTIDEVEAKLILGRKDNKVFKKLVEKRIKREELKNEKIIQAYYFFKEMLQDSRLQWQNIYTKLLDSLDLVLMVTDSYYDAFRLFETLNNRGLSLSSVDLIKNYLLSKFAANESVLEECIEIWDSIIENIEDIESVRHDKVRFFRHYLFSIEYGVVPIPKLYSKYQKLIDSSDNLYNLVEDIWLKSKMYLKLYNGTLGIKEVDDRLKTIVRIEGTTSYPLLMKCLSENLNKEQFINIFEAIEVFTLRRSICNISTRDIDRIYNHLALESFSKENPVSYIVEFLKKRAPTDNEFYLNFQNRDFTRSAQTKYILEMIENALTNNTKEKTISGRTDVHIEHIMPREIVRKSVKEIETTWQKELGSRAPEYSMFVNRIGNLTLLGSELNISASNYPFLEKKKKYEQSIIMLTKEICQEEKWTFEEISIRSAYLAGIAKKIWNFNNFV
ncbi:DUF262 domain-containing HNH endonuclease family protein [Peribacillus sp. AS_2]|uniref:DUF262 domain-containing protein n=1 Tax=Peribacillus sp. AS_2 TaxID=2996755 RepID=UPI0022A7AD01|nr:DUF262 domain-containing HNH endonuclease family protein [Peribacillus sp. AS_2]MCZ0871253.1 DUF262 domain-containing HNH endonuclease family protein [Peribacillus sp. AS_2]